MWQPLHTLIAAIVVSFERASEATKSHRWFFCMSVGTILVVRLKPETNFGGKILIYDLACNMFHETEKYKNPMVLVQTVVIFCLKNNT